MMGTSKTTGFSTSLEGRGFYSSENSKTGNLQKNKTPKQQNLSCVTCPSLCVGQPPWLSLTRPPHPCFCLPICHALAGLEGDDAGPAEGQEDNATVREV